MARNGKSFQMGRFSSKTYISLAIFAAFLIFILFGLKRKKPVLVHDDLLENLQSQIDEQNVVIQEQKQRNKKIVEHFSQQENIDWISELNKNASAKGKTIVTHRHPDVIIGGAKRCGVGILKMFMEAHPRIRFRYADGHFFDRANVKKRKKWIYRFMMPMSITSEVTAEKTPNYMGAPYVPERIFEMFPKIQLIFILCNPAKRAFSDYKYLMRTKIQTNPDHQKHQVLLEQGSFNSSVNYYMKVIDEAFANGTIDHLLEKTYRKDSGFEVFGNSLYNKHLKRWLAVFPRNQILIIDGEKLVTEPYTEMQKVQKFLRIDEALTEKNFVQDDFHDQYNCVKKSHYLTCTPTNKRTNWNPTEIDDTTNAVERLGQFFKRINNLEQPFEELSGEKFDWAE